MIDYLNYYRDFLEKHNSTDIEIFLANNNYYNVEYIDNFTEYRHEEQITGVIADTLQPQGAATRAQVAAILQRFLSE